MTCQDPMKNCIKHVDCTTGKLIMEIGKAVPGNQQAWRNGFITASVAYLPTSVCKFVFAF